MVFWGGYSGKNLREGFEGGTHRKIIYFMCGFGHEINYFSMLVVGSFKYTLSEAGKSPAEVAKNNKQ